VIDDSKTFAGPLRLSSPRRVCEVDSPPVDGFDALSKIADHQPAFVFVYIMMPRLDGIPDLFLIKHNKVFKSDSGQSCCPARMFVRSGRGRM